MKKYLKIILWTVPAIIFVGFLIALAVLNSSGHGKVYEGTAKMYDDDGKIVNVDVSFEFNGDDELKIIMKMDGQSITNEYLCLIDGDNLYLVEDYPEFIGEINAYQFEYGPIDNGMVMKVLKCSKNITLRNVFVTFIVIGFIGLLANSGYVVYEVLKKKGIIKVKEKPSKDVKNNSEENDDISVEENKEKVDN